VALVTGGGTGIGRACCLLLASQGARVAVNYSRSAAEAADVVRTIHEAGGVAASYQADVSSDAQVRAMVDAVGRDLGAISLLVNNAGTTYHIPMANLEAVTDGIWDHIMDVNVRGMFYCARAVASGMPADGGAIVNIGSISGFTGAGSSLPYAVSKAAVHGLTKSLARALAPRIRVNAVAPGEVLTRWWAGREQAVADMTAQLLLQRTATPADIAQAVSVLLGQDSMTGQIVTVDGGQLL